MSSGNLAGSNGKKRRDDDDEEDKDGGGQGVPSAANAVSLPSTNKSPRLSPILPDCCQQNAARRWPRGGEAFCLGYWELPVRCDSGQSGRVSCSVGGPAGLENHNSWGQDPPEGGEIPCTHCCQRWRFFSDWWWRFLAVHSLLQAVYFRWLPRWSCHIHPTSGRERWIIRPGTWCVQVC